MVLVHSHLGLSHPPLIAMIHFIPKNVEIHAVKLYNINCIQPFVNSSDHSFIVCKLSYKLIPFLSTRMNISYTNINTHIHNPIYITTKDLTSVSVSGRCLVPGAEKGMPTPSLAPPLSTRATVNSCSVIHFLMAETSAISSLLPSLTENV